MEIEYELTPDDLYAFQWRAVFVSPRGRRTRRMLYLLWVLAVVLFAIRRLAGGSIALDVIAVVCGCALGVLRLAYMLRSLRS